MTKTLVVSLDLEMNQPSGAIIQLGACIGELSSGLIIDSISIITNPNEALDPRITALTGISTAAVSGSSDLATGYDALAAWLDPYVGTRYLNPLTWGGGDSIYLRDQLGSHVTHDRWLFGRRWTDVKTVFTAWRMAQGKPPEGGLARSMTKLGLSFEGRKHNARDDAINTFRTYIALMRLFNAQTA
jgi:inhibitor of KinA sporulation pathway (predicted exonuclease)